jgi:tRNA1(Val) A37 N6-methylase TrmN6
MSCPEPSLSQDAFWRGAFHLVQPRKGAYRSGMDALLVASGVAADASGHALDMGAGAGAIGFAVAARAPALHVVLAEKTAEMASCARAGLALGENRGLAGRISIIEADLLAPRAAREAAGLSDGSFDHVLSNPPFYPHGHRASPAPLRREALSMPDDAFLARWLHVASALSRHGASFLCIVAPACLPSLMSAMDGRFGAVGLLPVHARAGRPATRLLVAARRGSRAPLRMLPALTLADADGAATEQADMLSGGTLHLDL